MPDALPADPAPEPARAPAPARASGPAAGARPARAAVLLVGGVPITQHRPAPARDLYTGALFARRVRYAEAARRPWFVLSARRGLVGPDEVVPPGEADLVTRAPSYRQAWGAFVAEQLAAELGGLDGLRVEVHADGPLVDALRGPLAAAGAELAEPAPAGSRRQAVAWYDEQRASGPREAEPPRGRGPRGPAAAVDAALRVLTDASAARGVPEVVAAGPAGLDGPGLYAWWVDEAGAADLAAGLGLPLAPGLLYVGQAGATSPVTGRPSSATVWSRVGRDRGRGTTFSRLLAAVLAGPLGLRDTDDERLDRWVDEHLSVTVWPCGDGSGLAVVEESVLAALEPPMDLQGMKETPLHRRLRELRRARPRA